MSLPLPPPDDPMPLAIRWLDEANALGRRNPNALALATADANARPSVRMVLLKELAAEGYGVFYTNYGSRKAAELAATRRAAGVLYWDELGRQIRFEGAVVRSPATESDAYFASRHWRSQVNAWASEQSRPLVDALELERRAELKGAEIGVDAASPTPQPGRRLPRPAFWGGFRLWFDSVELWLEGANRFHERLVYKRELEPSSEHAFAASRWTWQRLQP